MKTAATDRFNPEDFSAITDKINNIYVYMGPDIPACLSTDAILVITSRKMV